MSEQHICPRRIEGPVPTFLADKKDTWETSRWDTEDSKWPGDNSPKPRTCSYCGCAHPEDLINLLKSGWEMYLSDKKYKAYAQPKTNPHSLVPPVKFYAMHGTDDQIAELNNLLHAQ